MLEKLMTKKEIESLKISTGIWTTTAFKNQINILHNSNQNVL